MTDNLQPERKLARGIIDAWKKFEEAAGPAADDKKYDELRDAVGYCYEFLRANPPPGQLTLEAVDD